MLLNPLDAVQWPLYYPGILSYRDYPLSGVKPALLQEHLAALERQVALAPQDLEAPLALGEVRFDLGRREDARQAFEEEYVERLRRILEAYQGISIPGEATRQVELNPCALQNGPGFSIFFVEGQASLAYQQTTHQQCKL